MYQRYIFLKFKIKCKTQDPAMVGKGWLHVALKDHVDKGLARSIAMSRVEGSNTNTVKIVYYAPREKKTWTDEDGKHEMWAG